MANGKDSKRKTEALLIPDPEEIISEIDAIIPGEESDSKVAATGPNSDPGGKQPQLETSGNERSQPHGTPTESVGQGEERTQDPAFGGGKGVGERRPRPKTPRPTCMGPNCMKVPRRSSKSGFEEFCSPLCEHSAKAAAEFHAGAPSGTERGRGAVPIETRRHGTHRERR